MDKSLWWLFHIFINMLHEISQTFFFIIPFICFWHDYKIWCMAISLHEFFLHVYVKDGSLRKDIFRDKIILCLQHHFRTLWPFAYFCWGLWGYQIELQSLSCNLGKMCDFRYCLISIDVVFICGAWGGGHGNSFRSALWGWIRQNGPNKLILYIIILIFSSFCNYYSNAVANRGLLGQNRRINFGNTHDKSSRFQPPLRALEPASRRSRGEVGGWGIS